MREIKFRAWNGNQYNFEDFVIYPDGRFEYPEGGWDLQGFYDDGILEQFTGLHDNTKWEDLTEKEKNEWLKNLGNTSENWPGKKIYEGDIVEWNRTTGYDDGCATVEWIGDECCIKLVNDERDIYDTIWEFDNLLIIGNIHENPEYI